jgi:hypothetical protein
MNNEENGTMLDTSCLYSLNKETYSSVVDHPDFKYFCKLISEIQLNRAPEKREEGIKRDQPMYFTGQLTGCLNGMRNVLLRMFGVKFNITLIDNDLISNDFFGVNVFPDEKYCKRIADIILEKEVATVNILKDIWCGIDEWQLDLDSRMFYDLHIALNPAEIAALIIYNIENTIFNLAIIEKTNMVVSSLLSDKSILITKLARTSICKKAFIIPLIVACKFKSYPYRTSNFLPGSCFFLRPDLYSFLNSALVKVITTTSNKDINVPHCEMNKNIKQAAEWFFSCVDDMRFSTKMLGETIDKILRIEVSPYLKNIYSNLLLTIGDYTRSQVITRECFTEFERKELEKNDKAIEFKQKQYKRQAWERIKEQYDKVLKEGFFDLLDNIGNMKRVSQKEIDYLRVQGQKIRNADDKLFVLDTVHDKIEIVDASLAILDSNDSEKKKKVKVSKSELLDQKKQLETIRNEIINKDVEERPSLIIQYPKGYEG